jgi:hypothetical protein
MFTNWELVKETIYEQKDTDCWTTYVSDDNWLANDRTSGQYELLVDRQ